MEVDENKKVEVVFEVLKKISLASFQNEVSVIRDLKIVNNQNEKIEDLELTMKFEPGLVGSKHWRLSSIGPQQEHRLKELDLQFDGKKLKNLNESMVVCIQFALSSKGEVLFETEERVRFLANNEWGGLNEIPELISAFIQPNDQAVARIIKKTSEILLENGRDSAINGYQKGAKRAWELGSAVWAAVSRLNITYCEPPASFELDGQKVRSPSQIMDTGLATCLDTTLLFCSVLEQCGLHPIVIFTKGHAFAGYWLIQDSFAMPVVDDVAGLRHRIGLDEIVVFETTLVTSPSHPKFSQAISVAKQSLAPTEDSFVMLVDVAFTRKPGYDIKPLVSDWELQAAKTEVELEAMAIGMEDVPEITSVAIVEESELHTPQGRVNLWKRKLLDLTLRNKLLNFKASGHDLELLVPEPAYLEDCLANQVKFKLIPAQNHFDGSSGRSQELYQARTLTQPQVESARNAVKNKNIIVKKNANGLDGSLTHLYRAAQLAMQEGGVNTLFLAIGCLKWKKDERSDRVFSAPLVLLPVQLERISITAPFYLSLFEDEPSLNPALREMLRQDFRLNIPLPVDQLPKDEHGIDIEQILKIVGHAVKNMSGWEVESRVFLATFSFAKFLMWKDLDANTDKLLGNHVVKHLIEKSQQTFPSQGSLPNPRSLDKLLDPKDVFCPLSSDSSQLAAVVAADMGKSFILEGPPGTGKSQTITNIIAHMLGKGKTVLFVSEKVAALEVVYRRLKQVGLEDYCLELHSHKANKLKVVTQIQQAITASHLDAGWEWEFDSQRLKDTRARLNAFVEALHERRSNGWNAFKAIGMICKRQGIPVVKFSWSDPDCHDRKTYQDLEKSVKLLRVYARTTDTLRAGGFTWIQRGDYSRQWQSEIETILKSLIKALSALEAEAESFLEVLEIEKPALSFKHFRALGRMKDHFAVLQAERWPLLAADAPFSLVSDLQKGLDALVSYDEALKKLPTTLPVILRRAFEESVVLVPKIRALLGKSYVEYEGSIAEFDWVEACREWEILDKGNILKKIAKISFKNKIKALIGRELPQDFTQLLSHFADLQQCFARLAVLQKTLKGKHEVWRGLNTNLAQLKVELFLDRSADVAAKKGDWSMEETESFPRDLMTEKQRATLQILQEVKAAEEKLATFKGLEEQSRNLWKGKHTDKFEVKKFLQFFEDHGKLVSALSASPGEMMHCSLKLIAVYQCFFPPLSASEMVLKPSQSFSSVFSNFLSVFKEFVGEAGCLDQNTRIDSYAGSAQLKESFTEILNGSNNLKNWCDWVSESRKAMDQGLGELLSGFERGEFQTAELIEVFEASYARWWLDSVYDQDPVLKSFSSSERERLIEEFSSLDDRLCKNASQMIRARIRERIQGFSDQYGGERTLINRQVQRKRGHLPVRELIRQIPNTFSIFAPCVLMSPLSIAQYLPVDSAKFDLVVFDEASQIPTWEGVGAIARGRQVVMVGDDKQLPPTSFFQRADVESDFEEEFEDLDSILEECMAMGLPRLKLNWHYRSRHESLIDFSNRHYYQNELITFPSPYTQDKAVSFHYQKDGVFDRGKSRTNKVEARAVVKDIIDTLNSFLGLEDDKRKTVGVVTFNASQQQLIEELLDAERRKQPQLDPFFTQDNEPVFVKNLENVQGDERDIIYFSTTYGPDEAGVFRMNFGPINRDSGQRRLNVAITRARHEMKVFSSLPPEKIDLTRSNQPGVVDFKHFLEFAERGSAALSEAWNLKDRGFDSPFEQAVAEALQQKGWKVVPQVGVSSFRIDLGVVHPQLPGVFLAGIECDGATYHSSATARDRDKLREQVLVGLGWKILRIWSTDWWLNPDSVVEKIHGKLEQLLSDFQESEGSRHLKEDDLGISSDLGTTKPLDEGLEAEPIPSQPTLDHYLGELSSPAPENQAETASFALRVADRMSLSSELNISSDHDMPLELEESEKAPFPIYRAIEFFEDADPDRFYDTDYDQTLLQMISQVVTEESPILEDLLVRRITKAHNWKRAGNKIRERVLSLAQRLARFQTEEIGVFVWSPGSDPETLRFRMPTDEYSRRPDEVSDFELKALVQTLSKKGLEMEDLISEMASHIGIKKISSGLRGRFSRLLHDEFESKRGVVEM